jgi:hypothetical protein
MNDGNCDGWRTSSYTTNGSCVEVHMHWRKSSRSESNGCVEVGIARTSSHSALYDNCVEVEGLPEGGVAVRHSKDRDGQVLKFTPTSWQVLLDAIRRDEFSWHAFEPLDFNPAEREAFLAGVRDGEFELSHE